MVWMWMYYSDIQRIKKIEGWLEKLAYLSVGLDFFVAMATYFLIKGYGFSSFMLLLGSYLLFVEVIIAGFMVMTMIALRHYKSVLRGLDHMSFQSKYPKASRNSFILLRILMRMKDILGA